jgi:hypothetical protein
VILGGLATGQSGDDRERIDQFAVGRRPTRPDPREREQALLEPKLIRLLLATLRPKLAPAGGGDEAAMTLERAAPKILLRDLFGARVERRRQRLERLAPKVRYHPPASKPQRTLALARLDHEQLLATRTVRWRDVVNGSKLTKHLELLDLQLDPNLAELGFLRKAPAHRG